MLGFLGNFPISHFRTMFPPSGDCWWEFCWACVEGIHDRGQGRMDAASGMLAPRSLIKVLGESNSLEINTMRQPSENGEVQRPGTLRHLRTICQERCHVFPMSAVTNRKGEESHIINSLLNLFFLAAVSNLSGIFHRVKVTESLLQTLT